MFQDDDWDIGDDYLKDFDDSNIVSSIRPREDNSCELPPKKPRLDNFVSQSNNKSNTVGKEYKSQILNIFNNENSNENLQTETKKTPKKFGLEKFIYQGKFSDCPKPNTEKQVKNQDLIQEKDPKENPTKTLFKKPDTKLNFSKLSSDNTSVKICTPQEEFRELSDSTSNFFITEKLKKKTGSLTFRCTSDSKPSETFTSQKIKNNLKRNVAFDILTECDKNIPKKQTVKRRFPGPAGLLPENKLSTSLENLDENLTETEDSTNICSQNTKMLFSEGAWQNMTDDLPSHVELFEISAIKENAEKFSRECKKVPYIGGLIQSINWKPADPVVVLKDISGEISACLHRSIPTRYPNVLGRGIVLLLKDIGMIMRNAKSVNIIISSKNLVGIYSATDKIICTGFESLFQENETILDKPSGGQSTKTVFDDNWNTDFDFVIDENELLTSTQAVNTNTEKSVNNFVEDDADDELLSQLDMDSLTATCGT